MKKFIFDRSPRLPKRKRCRWQATSDEIEKKIFFILPKLPHTARIEKAYFSISLKIKPNALYRAVSHELEKIIFSIYLKLTQIAEIEKILFFIPSPSPPITSQRVLPTASNKEDATQMVDQLIEDFTTIIVELKEGMEAAQKASDETTADMLFAIHTTLKKHVWMLNAFNGK